MMDTNNSPQLVDSEADLREMGLVHRVAEPAGAGPYPTLVMLHGRYGDENVMWLFRQAIPAHWLKIAPRGIVEGPSERFSWVPREDNIWPELDQFDPAADAVHKFLSSLSRVYNSDPQRLYLMGFSQGAATAYAVAMRYPGLVQGIAGLVGFVPEGCEEMPCLSALQDVPIFAAAGKRDPLIPLERAQQSAAVLRRGGAKLMYREYDVGHKLNRQGMNDLRTWWQGIDRNPGG